MVRVRVRDDMAAHLVSVELLEDPLLRAGRACVDEHVADEVDVDRVGGRALELMHALGQGPHRTILCHAPRRDTRVVRLRTRAGLGRCRA